MKKEIKLEWHNEKRKISDLIPYESNPRQITEKQYSDLKKSVTKFNLAEIPAINLDNKICAGHQRLKAMSEVYGNDFEIDVRVPNRKLSEKEFKEYNVRSNKNTAGWEYDILANEFEIEELTEWGFEEWELGIKDFDTDIDVLTETENDIDGMGKTFGLYNDIDFERIGKYDFPKLKEDMFLEKKDILNTKIYYGKDTVENPPYYFIYGSYSIKKTDLENSIISFYTDDVRFEKLYNNPADVVPNLINAKVKGAISPDFSTYFNMPKAVRIFSMYKSFYCGRYLQECGIKLIPNVIGSLEDLKENIECYPKEKPLSIQIHRKYNNEELSQKKQIIELIISELKPNLLVCYVPLNKESQFTDVLTKTECHFIETSISKRQNIIKNG